MPSLIALSNARAFVRQRYPFTLALGVAIALIVFKGGSLTENFIFVLVMLPFAIALTRSDLTRLLRNPVLLALFIYLVALAVSLIGNGTATHSDLSRALQKIVVECVFVAFITWHIGRARPSAETGLALAFGGIIAFDVLLSIWWSPGMMRSGGVFILAPWPNQNTGAAVSTVAVLLLANAFIQSSSRLTRFAIAIMTSIVFAAVLLSRSRTALIAIVLALLISAVLQWRWRGLALVAVVLAGAFALIFLTGFVDVRALWMRGDASRVFLWTSFGDIAKAHVWRGIGIDREFSINFRVPSGDQINNPHNMFVLSALYAGVAALITYVALLIASLATGFRLTSNRSRGLAQSLAVFLVLYGMFESAVMISHPDWLWLVFLVPIGCIAGVWFPAFPAAREGQRET